MGNGFQGDVKNSRQARRRAIDQAWQLAAVPLGQVRPGGTDVFFDEVVIVQQPLRSRGSAAAGQLCGPECCAAVFENQLVVAQAAQ
ncbi:hypothetical protein D9M71_155720 [compost metagenome]